MDSKTGLSQKPPIAPPIAPEATTGNIEMPGVTQLLNRKSLGLPPALSKKTPPVPASTAVTMPATPPVALPATDHTQNQIPPSSAAPTPTQLEPAPSIEIPQESSSGGISLSDGAPEKLELEHTQMQSASHTETHTEHTEAHAEAPAAVPPQDEPAIKPQTRSRQHHPSPAPLIQWTLEQLSQGKDPLGQGLKQLHPHGVQCALFLKVQAPQAGSKFPHFTSTAALTPENKLTLWEGLSWYPDVTPELWQQFIQTGFVELSPPNTQTIQTSHRNVVRAAFGVHRQEWLLMIRVGSVTSCRGVLIIISNASLLPSLPASLPLFTADLPKAA